MKIQTGRVMKFFDIKCSHAHLHKLHIKQEQQILKQSIFTIFTRFCSSHLPYIIDHCECSGYLMPLYKGIFAQFQLSHNLVTGVNIKVIHAGIKM